MRPEANLQRRGGRSSSGFSGLLASSGSLVTPLHRWKSEKRNHIRHHQPKKLTVRESGVGPIEGFGAGLGQWATGVRWRAAALRPDMNLMGWRTRDYAKRIRSALEFTRICWISLHLAAMLFLFVIAIATLVLLLDFLLPRLGQPPDPWQEVVGMALTWTDELAISGAILATVVVTVLALSVHYSRNGDRTTLLHFAPFWDSSPLAKALMGLGVEGLTARDTVNGGTPLHWAAAEGSQATAKSFLRAGAVADASDGRGASPLHWAGTLGADSRDQDTAARDKVRRRFLAIFDTLREAGASIDARDNNGFTPLHWAVVEGSETVVRCLIAAGAAINDRGQCGFTPLHLAARGGTFGTTKALLDAGGDVHATSGQFMVGPTALHLAAKRGAPLIVKALLDFGSSADVLDRDRRTPLHSAAKGGSHSVVSALLDAGADVGSRDMDGMTPLHVAARAGSSDAARVLLDAGADVETRSKEGFAPLHLAASWGEESVVASLIESGADVDDRADNGGTALHDAAAVGAVAVVKALLAVGANPDAIDGDSRTPLHEATQHWTPAAVKVIRALLESGASISARDDHGRTPKDLAREKRDQWASDSRRYYECNAVLRLLGKASRGETGGM